MKIKILLLSLFLIVAVHNSQAQIGVSNGTATVADIVTALVGQGVTVSNASLIGAGTASNNRGLFSNGLSTAGITSGIVLCTGNINDIPNNNSATTSTNFSGSGDANLTTLAGKQTYDAIGVQFDIVPESNFISFNYVFGSEEYMEYVGSAFSDAVAFFITSLDPDGLSYNLKNLAVMPGTSTPVSINSINTTSNSQYFRSNESGSIALEPDGLTTVLTASCAVQACKHYRIKIVIADVSDGTYDSYLFLQGTSFQSPTVSNVDLTYSVPSAGTNAIEGCNNSIFRFNLSSPAASGGRKIPFTLGGTATELRLAGADYTSSPSVVSTYSTTYANKYYVTVPEGQNYVDLTFMPTYDGVVEGDETIVVTTDLSLCGTQTVSNIVTIKDRTSIVADITNTSPVNICATSGVTLSTTASGGWTNGGSYSYSWSPSSGLSSSIIASPVATPLTSSTYTVVVSDMCGNTASDEVTVLPYHAGGSLGLWYGDISSDASDCRNWAKGFIPDATVDVLIPSTGVTNWPIASSLTVGTDWKSITLQNNAQLTITGNLTINTGKNFTCDGNAIINVGGNWFDWGTFSRGTSTLVFNGSGTQEVNKNINRQYIFYNVTIDGSNVVMYYYDGKEIDTQNITINSGKKLSTVKQ